MILDTSALVAIFLEEPEAEVFGDLIVRAAVCRISVVSRLELAMVLENRRGSQALFEADALLEMSSIMVEPVTLEQGLLAREAFRRFGRGRHRAKLNFGDCFSYALAKAMDEPLLFKGDDFIHTDVRLALRTDSL